MDVSFKAIDHSRWMAGSGVASPGAPNARFVQATYIQQVLHSYGYGLADARLGSLCHRER